MGVARLDPEAGPPRGHRVFGQAEGTRERILVVDDDEDVRGALEAMLRAERFEATAQPDGEAALAEAIRAPPHVVLTDLRMRGISGVELCQRLHEIDPDLPVIIMTGSLDVRSVIESLRVGAEDYLIKPFKMDEVLLSVERAIARLTAKRERDLLNRTLNERLVLSSIREQEHAEAEMEQRLNLNTLLENLSEGVIIAEPSGRILTMNDAGRAILGLGDEKANTFAALVAPDAHDLEGRPLAIEQRCLTRALRGERFTDVEVLRTRPNGVRRRVASTGTSVRDKNGNVALAIVLFRDVTDLRRLERQHDEYLALISHDLRSPLGSILVYLSGLKRSMAKRGMAEDVNWAERAEQNVERMAAMLTELTDATTLESQGVTLRSAACDLRELITGVVHRMDDSRALRITIEADDSLPCVVFVDAARLERVVDNLLTNALKYSADDAPVNVRLARQGSDVELEVVDRGIGIAPESMNALFNRYYRTTGGMTRASGLGLGLYIARLIVEAHGGRIEVSSEVGKGSTFKVILPAQAVVA